jgi:tetratricopeptide (TPR) repeat protein
VSLGSPRGRPSPCRPLLLAVALVGLAAAPAVSEPEPRAQMTVEEADRVVRSSLENGRALRRDGRLELAEYALRRGLRARPDDAALHRELALVLEAAGRADDARAERDAADALEPPPPPLPELTLGPSFRDVAVALVAPPPGAKTSRGRRSWPRGEVAETLHARLRLRLPQAQVEPTAFETVAEARAWLARSAGRAALTLRVERIYCGDTVKDGRFGVSRLRLAVALAGGEPAVETLRTLVVDPRLPGGCGRELAARSLEQALTHPATSAALAAVPAAAPSWSRAAVRALFPDLGERIERELADGHALLARGRIEAAAQAFRRAAEIDPDEPAVRAYLREAEATLALSEELERRRGGREGGVLDPRLNLAQIQALEAQLASERRRREELLAALAVLEQEAQLPDAARLRALRPAQIRDPEAFGPALARRRAGGRVVARAALAPDGSLLARYYFPADEALPVLREEDTNGDGTPDRWIAYAGDTRSEVWEADGASGRPELRLVYGEGQRLVRVELDRDVDGRPERLFRYRGGKLRLEASDVDADGRLDTFDHFGADGELRLRERDLNGDGEIDERSFYEAGRLVRRQLTAADGAAATRE